MNTDELVQLVLDTKHGRSLGKYSKNDALETYRQALIELNGGSEKFTAREIRDSKHNGLFTLVEKTVGKLVVEGIPENNPLFKYVEMHNMADGEGINFEISDDGLFVVSKIVNGLNNIRRQRLTGGETIAVVPELMGVSFYDELRRLMAGRTDILKLTERCAKSFIASINNNIYSEIVAAFDKLTTPYVATGTFDQKKLISLIDHVEASTGKKAMVIGSKQGVTQIQGIAGSDSNTAKEDLYNFGYYGHVGTTPVFAMTNAHKPGTNEFILGNDLYVIAGDDQFVKLVIEGDTLIMEDKDNKNKDNSQAYSMYQNVGVEVIFSAQCAVYKLPKEA